MGKKMNKKKKQQQPPQCQHVHVHETTSSNNANKKSEENKLNPQGVIVLGIYIHCQGCANEVRKSLRGFDGVEVIEINEKKHQVTIRGKKANPTKVAERLRRKTKRHVELISPILPKQEEKEENKKEKPKVIEVILKVFLHCEGCAKDIKQCIHSMQGVQTVDPDIKSNLITVKGTFESERLIKFIIKRTGKHAEMVKSKKVENKDEENANKCDQGFMKTCVLCSYHPHAMIYGPQLFSDENPNSCSIL